MCTKNVVVKCGMPSVVLIVQLDRTCIIVPKTSLIHKSTWESPSSLSRSSCYRFGSTNVGRISTITRKDYNT